MTKIGFVSLGCPKNLVDSEVMMGLLKERGHVITADEREAEVIVVNTCSFIDPAKRESIETILEMAELKRRGNCRRLVVAGCLVERYRRQLLEAMPEVDAAIGTNQIPRIVEACEGRSAWANRMAAPPDNSPHYLYSHDTPRLRSTPRHWAYIKISEGCDHACSFCVIPKLRGPHRSRPIGSILQEAESLAAQGVRELNLVAQDSTSYGADLGMRYGLAELLRRLAEVDGIEWIRFLYAYPNSVDDAALEVIAGEPKICKYVDIPLQHASGRILSAMRRGGNRKMLSQLLERIRTKVPGVAIRTTMIVGFPGETEEDFQELLDFCRQMEFDRLGVFAYSDEEGTHAYTLADKIDERTKIKRRDKLMRQQAKISLRKNRQLIGKHVRVLIDGPSRETDLLYEARMESQAPDIDGVVLINDAPRPPEPGQFCTVQITDAYEYDLVGRIVSAEDTNYPPCRARGIRL